MTKGKLDQRYYTTRVRKDGTVRHFWTPSPELRKLGYKETRVAADTDDATQAAREIDAKNKAIDAARKRGDMPSAAVLEDRTLAAAIALYKATDDFTSLGEKTAANYTASLTTIAQVFGDIDVRQITRDQVIEFLKAFSDTPAKRHALYRNFRTLMYFVEGKNWIVKNPAARLKKIPRPAPRVVIWTREEIPALVDLADERGEHELADAIVILAETAMRRGDCLALEPKNWNAERRMFTIKPSKTAHTTGVILDIPATPYLAARMERLIERRRQMAVVPRYLVPMPGGNPLEVWEGSCFTHAFEELRTALALKRPAGTRHMVRDGETLAQFAKRCGTQVGCVMKANQLNTDDVLPGRELLVPDVSTKHLGDFRDTAVTRLARAGNTIPYICSITGHSLASAYHVLRHYLSISGDMAEEAIKRLVDYENKKATNL